MQQAELSLHRARSGEKTMNEDQTLLIGIVGWAIVGALVGFVCGKFRAREGFGAFLGALLGPLGWLIVIGSEDRRRRCPDCKSVAILTATKCRHCGAFIPLKISA